MKYKVFFAIALAGLLAAGCNPNNSGGAAYQQQNPPVAQPQPEQPAPGSSVNTQTNIKGSTGPDYNSPGSIQPSPGHYSPPSETDVPPPMQ